MLANKEMNLKIDTVSSMSLDYLIRGIIIIQTIWIIANIILLVLTASIEMSGSSLPYDYQY